MHIQFLALIPLAFTTRRIVRSAHFALSVHCTVWFCRFRYIFVRENAYCIVGTARWADLCTRHHMKPSPKGSALMWWLVLRWAHVAFPKMPYAYNLRRPSLKDQRNYTYFRFCIEIGARPLSPMQGIRFVGSSLYPIFSHVRYSHIPYKTYYSVVQSQKAVTAHFLVSSYCILAL